MENNRFLKKENEYVFKYNVYSDGEHILATDNAYKAVCVAETATGVEREVRVTLPDGIHSRLVYICSGTVDDDFEEMFPLNR